MRTGSVQTLMLLLTAVVTVQSADTSERKQRAFSRLMDKYDEALERISSLESTVASLKQKLNDHLYYCPEPMSIAPGNTQPDVNNGDQGATVTFSCNDDYYQCGTNAVYTCRDDRSWDKTGSSHCVKSVNLVESPELGDYSFSCTLPTDGNVTVKGVPTQNKKNNRIVQNTVYFQSNGKTRVFHVTHTANKAYADGSDASSFPFEINQEFTFLMKKTSNGVEIYVNGKWILDYLDLGRKPTRIEFQGDVLIYSYKVEFP